MSQILDSALMFTGHAVLWMLLALFWAALISILICFVAGLMADR